MGRKNRPRLTKNAIQYYILIKKDDKLYKVGSIKINNKNWDIYYFPGASLWLTLTDGVSGTEYSENRKIEHLSFHASGEFHIIVEKGTWTERLSSITGCILELGKDYKYDGYQDYSPLRSPLKDVNIQELIHFFVKDYTKLELFVKKVDDLDIIFDADRITTNIISFSLSMISENLIQKHLQNVESGNIEKPILETVKGYKMPSRFLMYSHDNKELQHTFYELNEYTFQGDSTLRIFYENTPKKY